MKCKYFVLPCVLLGLLFSSCGDEGSDQQIDDSAASASEGLPTKESKDDVRTAELVELVESPNPEIDEKVEKIKEVQKKQKAAPVKEEEVHDVAGFAKHMPKETEMFFNAQDIAGLINTTRDTKIGSMLAELLKKEGDDIDAEMQSEEFQEFLNVAGEEVFLAMGDGSAKSLKSIGDVYSIYYRMYYYIIGKMMISELEGDNLMENPERLMRTVMKPVLDEFLEMDNYSMPRIYAGVKVSNKEDRDRYVAVINGGLDEVLDLKGEAEGLFKEATSDLHGGFKGVSMDYSKYMDMLKKWETDPNMAEGMKMMKSMGMTDEYMKKLTEKFKDFKLTIMVGVYNDYVVIYFGDTEQGLNFVEKASDSLLANKEMEFLKEYKDKEVVSMTYISKEISSELSKVTTMMEDLSAGVNKFLGETDSLGDTSHIAALLKKIAVNGRKLDSLSLPSKFGSVAYLEDGFKIDSFHGGDSAMYDLDARRKLADIAMRDDAAFSSSWVVNEENAELAIQGMEDMVNLAYQITKLVVEHDIDDPDFQEFADMFKMLDAQFSDDLAANWNFLRAGMRDGLGNEGAVVMDLKGKMPRVPDVPTVILENGKIPRLAIGYDVKNRSKLRDSWKSIDATNLKIVAKLERLTNEKINYRKPELAKQEGMDFWSYQLGVTSFDANLAVGLNEEMMFFTSAPSFVEGFLPDYDADGKRGGMDFKLRLAPARELVNDWMKLMDKHGAEISPNFNRDEFEKSRTLINEMLKTSEEVDSVDFSMRKINGEVRSFFHLNKK